MFFSALTHSDLRARLYAGLLSTMSDAKSGPAVLAAVGPVLEIVLALPVATQPTMRPYQLDTLAHTCAVGKHSPVRIPGFCSGFSCRDVCAGIGVLLFQARPDWLDVASVIRS